MTLTQRAKARRKAAKDARLKRVNTKCPTPNKRSYATDAAIQNALRSSKRSGKPMRIYKCPCGSLHLTQRVIPATERNAA